MKRLILSSFSLLLMVGAAAPAVRAQAMTENPAAIGNPSNSIERITPSNLADLAYRGYFQDQGIPGYQTFASAYRVGKISGKKLVEIAISNGRLPSQTRDDKGYLSAVDNELEDLARQN